MVFQVVILAVVVLLVGSRSSSVVVTLIVISNEFKVVSGDSREYGGSRKLTLVVGVVVVAIRLLRLIM